MTRPTKGRNTQLDSIAVQIGAVVEKLHEIGNSRMPGEVHVRELSKFFPKEEKVLDAPLSGALAVLHIMGLIAITPDGYVRVTSKESRLVLGSLSKFLKASVQVVDSPELDNQELHYLIELTKALEAIRLRKPGMGREYIHERRFVNVLVKSRQIRNGHRRDVYLHIYHPKWRAYHLIGKADKHASSPVEKLTHDAIRECLGLDHHQYELDPNIKLDDLNFSYVSGSSGAYTNYVISVRAIKSIKIDLRLKEKIGSGSRWDHNSFRWFTTDEIREGRTLQHEAIMQSSSFVIEEIDPSNVPICIKRAEDIRYFSGLKELLINRFTKLQLGTLALLGFFSTILVIDPQSLLQLFSVSGDELIVLANYSQIIGAILSALALLYTIIKGARG